MQTKFQLIWSIGWNWRRKRNVIIHFETPCINQPSIQSSSKWDMICKYFQPGPPQRRLVIYTVCSTVQYAVQYGRVCSTIQYAVQYGTVCSTVRYSTVQYSMVRYGTVRLRSTVTILMQSFSGVFRHEINWLPAFRRTKFTVWSHSEKRKTHKAKSLMMPF